MQKAKNSAHHDEGDISYRPGQSVYRKQMAEGRKWLGPYMVVREVSDLLYKIRIWGREVQSVQRATTRAAKTIE
jgi:hypothetical protein